MSSQGRQEGPTYRATNQAIDLWTLTDLTLPQNPFQITNKYRTLPEWNCQSQQSVKCHRRIVLWATTGQGPREGKGQ